MKNKILEIFVLISYIFIFLLVFWFLIECIYNYEFSITFFGSIIFLIFIECGLINTIKEHIEDNMILYCKHCKKYVWIYKDKQNNKYCSKCSNLIKKYMPEKYNDYDYDEDKMP